MCGWMLNLICSSGASLLLRFWDVCGWMLNLFVFSSGASLLLRFGGVWVDVKFDLFFGCVVASKVWGCVGGCYICFFFWCVERLPASWEARLGRRISDCIVASKVWGCVGGC